MVEKSVTIKNKQGMHMRPSSEFTKLTAKCSSDVAIVYNGNSINAKSILNVMSAGIKCGDEIILQCSGENEEEELKMLIEAIESGLGEE